MTKKVLPIHRVLTAIDTNNMGFYNELNDEERKAFSPWLIMRYASSSEYLPEHYLLMVNSFVNVNFSDLSKHPELQWKLLALSGIGQTVRHTWLPPASKKKKRNKIGAEISKLYPHLKDDELDVFLKIHDSDELKQILYDFGYQDKEIKELWK